jgi:hypothetical protein
MVINVQSIATEKEEKAPSVFPLEPILCYDVLLLWQ